MARSQLQTICALLEKCGDRFPFARRLVTLAAKTVREMDKVAASVLQARHNETENAQDLELSGCEDGNSNEINRVLEVNDNVPAAQQASNLVNVMAEKFDYFQVPQIPEYNAEQYNAEPFDLVHKIPDLPDLFEHFDPGFDLDAVDFALCKMLGPPLSLTWIGCPAQKYRTCYQAAPRTMRYLRRDMVASTVLRAMANPLRSIILEELLFYLDWVYSLKGWGSKLLEIWRRQAKW